MTPQLVNETDGEFEMHDGKSPFRVPKAGLSESLKATIRSMAKEPDAGTVTFGEPVRVDPPAFSWADQGLGAPVPTKAPPVGPSFKGSELGFGAAPSKDAIISLPPQSSELAPGLAIEKPAEKTLVPTGRTVNGMPVVEEATGYINAPLPAGLRKVAPAPQPQQAPMAAPASRGTGGGSGLQSGLKAELGALEEAKGANVMAANAKAEEGRQQGELLAGVEQQLKAAAMAEQQRLDDGERRVAAAMATHAAAQDEMKNIDTTVDPGRYWASRSTGGKIAGIIGLALGSLSPDGVNRAAQQIDKAIDRDLDAQKAEHSLRLQKGQAAINAAQSAFAMSQQIFGNGQAASSAAKANLLALAQNGLAKITAGNANPAAAALAQQLNAQLDAQKAKATQDAAMKAAQIAHLNAETAAAGNKGPAGLPAAEQAKVFDVDIASQNIRDNVAKAKKLIHDKGTFELTGTEQPELERALQAIAQDSARLMDPGSTVKEGELAAQKKSIGVQGGEIFSLSNANAIKLLDSFGAGIDQRQDHARAIRGLAPRKKDQQ